MNTQGEQGRQGETGDTGLTGKTGETGDTGLTGARGIAGLEGEIGKIGLKGNQGNRGNRGEQGIPGHDQRLQMLIVYLFVALCFGLSVFIANQNVEGAKRNTEEITRIVEDRQNTKITADYTNCLAGRKFVLRMNKFYGDMATTEARPLPGKGPVSKSIRKTRKDRIAIYLRSRWTPIPDCSEIPKPE